MKNGARQLRSTILRPHGRRLRAAGFTLVELLVVIGLIVTFSGLLSLGSRFGGSGVARDGAVSLLASLVVGARSEAALRGVNAAVFIHADPANPRRYLRYLVVCVQEAGGWRPLDGGAFLPAGIVVVPNVNPLPEVGPGTCKVPGTDWSRPAGGDIRSTALRSPTAHLINTEVSELWVRIEFTPHGTTLATGDVVVGHGRLLGPQIPATVQLENPDDVAGLGLSQYGNLTVVRHRRDL